MDVKRNMIATDAQRRIKSWVETDPLARRLVRLVDEAFSDDQQVLLVGGALRDQLRGVTPKDFDVIVGISSLDALSKRLPEARKNFFGGLTFSIDGCAVDIWPLRETFHIKKFRLEPTVENFLAGAPFNLDKIAFDIRNKVLFDDGCLQGLERKEIVYAPLYPYLEHIQAVRCILLKLKTNFTLHESAQALLCRAGDLLRGSDSLVDEVHKYLQQAYGMDDVAVRREIITEITK